MLRKYALKRLLVAIPSLLIASVIVFSLARLVPGDVVTLMMEENQYAQDLEEMRAKLGLDRPIYRQYVEWMGRMARGDLGQSLYTGKPVLHELAWRLPVSLELGTVALVFAVLIGVPIGIVAAVRQDTLRDYVARSSAILGLSVPGFWLGTLVVVLPAIYFGWSPPIEFTRLDENPWRHVAQFLLPGFLLGVASAAAIMRLTRTQLLEVLRQDYVRTAWSKGLAEPGVVLKHSLKNALIPVVTVLGIQIAQILSGTVIFESIFGLPGMGRFLFDAITERDYPVIQGINLVIVATIVLVNLVVDVAYAWLDPRIRY
ncbi:MAG: glutathione ABC transporter permease GsiC [Candidatus Rokubacteria bacterium RBG_16_73_20]|nr:MAG: glutathione ABC transporter permease GsiC [Candidatus Rokubacteria bacterium RBG_16_73_20]HBH03418.1 glutathione ABC transporter permease GsiC [Candidatus Rokubacteria bacterium]